MAETPDTLSQILRQATDARVGLGRSGQSLPTGAMLALQAAHARAQDAVHTPLDVPALQAALGRPTLVVDSAAPDRQAYLQRPDLGRRLRTPLTEAPPGPCDLAIVVADGLSATAVHAHAAAVVAALIDRLAGRTLAPVVIARQGRVAIGDPIGQALGARIVLVLIGERPGLSAADSLGAYLTWAPAPGRRDSERNCVSNIRAPGGLAPVDAADKLAWLIREAGRLKLTGVQLKDRHEAGRLARPQSPAL